MGFKPKLDINSDFIYQHLSDFDILYAYRDGDLEIGSIESSKFRTDQHSSCGFYYSEKGKLIYNDIATSEKLDAFSYVAKLFKTNYKGALIRVAEDFGLTGLEPKYFKVDPDKIEIKPKEEKKIEVIADEWSKSYTDYWAQFSLTKEEVEKDVIPIKKLFIDNKVVPNYGKSIRFAYPVKLDDKLWYKIYSPYAENGAFKWLNNVPLYVPFGVPLQFKSKTLIISKSVKEMLLWRKYFIDCIAVQNESPAALRDKTIEYLKKRYNKIYFSFDIDQAGKLASKHFEEKGLTNLALPDILYTKYNIKDSAELVQKFGLKKFKDFIDWSLGYTK